MKSSTPRQKKSLSREEILNWYMADVLEGREPKNVYLFAKNHGIDESEFYKFYNGFDGIESHFFELIFDKTWATLIKASEYAVYDAKEKLLSFYYTFFGNLTQNRSFVLYLLPAGKWENLKKLKGLHRRFVDYVKSLAIEKPDLKHKNLNKLQDRSMEEAAWIQFLSVAKFWMQDQSPDFEKTDIYIEKSLTAAFELINTRPLKSVADLGKFIYKEFNPMG